MWALECGSCARASERTSKFEHHCIATIATMFFAGINGGQ
jgi:hypothetical protein